MLKYFDKKNLIYKLRYKCKFLIYFIKNLCKYMLINYVVEFIEKYLGIVLRINFLIRLLYFLFIIFFEIDKNMRVYEF